MILSIKGCSRPSACHARAATDATFRDEAITAESMLLLMLLAIAISMLETVVPALHLLPAHSV
jgi:hypothetical protein